MAKGALKSFRKRLAAARAAALAKTYECPSLVGRRDAADGTGYEYEVEWVGHPVTTWEPRAHMLKFATLAVMDGYDADYDAAAEHVAECEAFLLLAPRKVLCHANCEHHRTMAAAAAACGGCFADVEPVVPCCHPLCSSPAWRGHASCYAPLRVNCMSKACREYERLLQQQAGPGTPLEQLKAFWQTGPHASIFAANVRTRVRSSGVVNRQTFAGTFAARSVRCTAGVLRP